MHNAAEIGRDDKQERNGTEKLGKHFDRSQPTPAKIGRMLPDKDSRRQGQSHCRCEQAQAAPEIKPERIGVTHQPQCSPSRQRGEDDG